MLLKYFNIDVFKIGKHYLQKFIPKINSYLTNKIRKVRAEKKLM